MREGNGFKDKYVDVQGNPVLDILLKDRADTSKHLSCTSTICDNPFEGVTDLFEIGYGSIKITQTRVCVRYDRCKRLSDFMRNRRRNCVTRRQPRLALTTLGACPEQLIHDYDFVEQHEQHKTARQVPDDPYGIETRAEANGIWIVGERHLHQVQVHDNHQPQI